MAGLNRLTANKVKGHSKRGRLADGGGLYLDTRANGEQYWMFKRMRNGIARQIGLGSVSQVSLAQARAYAVRCREMQNEGRDPSLAIRGEGANITFAEVARQVIEIKKPEWRSDHTLKKWERNLLKYSKSIAARPIAQIERDHILTILRPLWENRNHTARATRKQLEIVLAYAKIKGWRTGDNPAAWENNLEFMLSKAKPKIKHHKAMPYAAVPAFAAAVDAKRAGMFRGGAPAALLFTILTCVRSNEARGALWEEFDFDAMTWTVPGDRTKTGSDYVVPLSKAAAGLIQDRAGSGIVFPGHRGKPMSDNTLRMIIRRGGDNVTTVHGFRSTFKDWATDIAKARDEVSEMCLGHLVGSAARRAYARSDAIDDRRALLERWAGHVMGEVHAAQSNGMPS